MGFHKGSAYENTHTKYSVFYKSSIGCFIRMWMDNLHVSSDTFRLCVQSLLISCFTGWIACCHSFLFLLHLFEKIFSVFDTE